MNHRKAAGAAAESRQGRMRLDTVDWRLLGLLQDDARMTSADLARRVDLSAPGVQKRLRKLEESGVIQRYATIVKREAIGLDLLCFVQVSLAHHEPGTVRAFRDAVKKLPEVLECHYLTGEFDYLMKVVVASHKRLEQFLFEKLTQVRGVDKIRTSIVLNEIKQSTSLPLGAWDSDIPPLVPPRGDSDIPPLVPPRGDSDITPRPAQRDHGGGRWTAARRRQSKR